MDISLQTLKPQSKVQLKANISALASKTDLTRSGQQISNSVYRPLSAFSFTALSDLAKDMETLRDKSIDTDGKIVSEPMTSTGSNLKLLTASNNIFNIVDLTESPVTVKPFSEKEFGPYKPHYIIETPSGFEGMFKFCCMDGHIIREVGARYLSKMLSMEEVMPETVFVKVKTPDYGVQIGSIQKMIPDGKSVSEDPSLVDKIKASPTATEELRQVILFNYIANNIDTGIGNWLVGSDMRLQSIDHALTGAGGVMLKGVAEKFPELQTIELNEPEKQKILAFLKDKKKNTKILEQFYPPSAVNRIFQTAEDLIAAGSFEI